MTIDPTSLGMIATAIVVLLSGVVATAIRWTSAQARDMRTAMAESTASVRQLLEATRGGNGADASGQWGAQGDVIGALERMRREFEKFADEMRSSTRDIHDTLGRHRVRLALLEQRGGLRRDDDSTRPGRQQS